MRGKVVILLVAWMLVTLVTGCGGAHRYDRRLVQADSLMPHDPDSALALVQGISPDSLPTPGDRAYRDLLLTQGRYKCYITATSDSDINRALAYYSHHSSEREKLTRAYIYKGAVMEELGYPDSAMTYYKNAETTVSSDDYFNLGFINLRIAQLYQSQLANDSAVVARMRIAQKFFLIIKDTSRLITTSGTIGIYDNIIGKDSARFYLNQAISLAQAINSPKGYQYKSKLAGMYFYDGDYQQAKDLAMDIFRNGKDECNENQFYHYAARSFIHLHQIDSARWLISQIPTPNHAVDSMNHFQTMAELDQATRHYEDYIKHDKESKVIDADIMNKSRNNNLIVTEVKCEADQHEGEIKSQAIKIVSIVLMFIAVLLAASTRIIHRRISKYRENLKQAGSDLENLINDLEEKKRDFESERKKLMGQISEKEKKLSIANRKNLLLEQRDQSVHERASKIVRERNAALSELYDNVRLSIQSNADEDKKIISLSRLMKDYHDNKAIRMSTVKETFWKKLKSSVDLEYNGIASFVEKNYPQLAVKDFHFFCLVCANIPSRIIMLCMNYGSSVTVSKYKARFFPRKLGIDMTFEEFINLYLQGHFNSK